MKKLIYIVAFSSLIASCDTRKEYFENQNAEPKLVIFDQAKNERVFEYKDSVKIALKSSRKSITLRLEASDSDNNLSSLEVVNIVGKCLIKQDGKEVTTINFNKELLDIEIIPTVTGTNILNLVLTDAFGTTSTVKITLEAFINLEPKAILSDLISTKVESSLHYTIDASSSSDRDGFLGGGIILYEYTLEGNTFSSKDAKIPYIFSSGGNKTLSLRVKDSDGVWSTSVSRTYSVN